ncbi:tetratricopeptide repeat protein [Moritella dasanensis]|uniref:tetratricopeptide repeat protein n=1 Tax=Moritella dasanensis TaxID=428031 RepID=UPI0002D57D2D|nr:tetratricopeptide repeat protein [Moritella dasanensis]
MSVINQMLKGLDKGAQKQQAVVESNCAVIVATPNTHNKVVIALVSSIIIFAALASYLFVQKQSRTAKLSVSQDIVVPAVSREQSRQVNEPLLANALPAAIVETPVSAQREIEKPAMTEPSNIVVPSVNKVVVPVATSSTTITATASTITAKQDNKITVARIETITPKVVKPAVVSAPQMVAKRVELAAPDADIHDEDSVSIKTVTRTPLQQAQLYAKQAEAALLAGDKGRAKILFTKVLSFDKQHDLSREKLAAILYGEQRTQSAVNLLQEGLSVSPEYTNFRLMLARIYLKNKNKSQAYYYLKPHQPQVQGNVDYYAILAGLAQNLDDLDTALVAYKKLTVHQPNRAKWWLGLGITADKAKQVKLALQAYHTAQNMGQLSASSRNYINTRITQLEKQ